MGTAQAAFQTPLLRTSPALSKRTRPISQKSAVRRLCLHVSLSAVVLPLQVFSAMWLIFDYVYSNNVRTFNFTFSASNFLFLFRLDLHFYAICDSLRRSGGLKAPFVHLEVVTRYPNPRYTKPVRSQLRRPCLQNTS